MNVLEYKVLATVYMARYHALGLHDHAEEIRKEAEDVMGKEHDEEVDLKWD